MKKSPLSRPNSKRKPRRPAAFIKVRCDAVLKTLSEERQQLIIKWAETPKNSDCVGGYAFARAQIAAVFGLTVGIDAISDLYHWRRNRAKTGAPGE